jgi:FAD/FMN-containing dehydrogenase
MSVSPSYLEDASGYRGSAEALFAPSSEQELLAVLTDATRQRIPVTIAGAGTGLAGGRVPHEGWIIALEKFTNIEIGDGHARVGAGVLLRDLQKAAGASGQFYAPDPTEMAASIGGTIATNASGSRSFRYGDTRRHVLSMRVAFMDGTLREFSRGEKLDFPVAAIPLPQTTKHSAGFPLYPGMDWVDLFIGSEGTLGVVTEATVRLLPVPGEMLAGVCFFKKGQDALEAVDAWRPIPRLRMLEYFDRGALRLLSPAYPEIPDQARAALLIEQEMEDESEIDDWVERLDKAHALTEQSWFADSDKERERFRKFRHALPEMVNSTVRQRGLLKMGTDFAVPIARNQEMMSEYRRVLDPAFPDQYVIFGHIGDAHVHVNILPRNSDEADIARNLIDGLAKTAVLLGGTVAAEHGLGKRKRHLLKIQYSSEQIGEMESVKRHLDPQWLLGRGNLFSAPEPTSI